MIALEKQYDYHTDGTAHAGTAAQIPGNCFLSYSRNQSR